MSQTWGSQITAQSSQTGTADTRVTAGQTELDNDSGGNIAGAVDLSVELDVTTPPSTATHVKLYAEYWQNSTKWSEPKHVGTFRNVGTAAQEYHENVAVVAVKTKLSWEPIGYGLTATLSVRAATL